MVNKAGQKRKKAEKAKTKLKTSTKAQKKGKKIRPKGGNETRFDVKTKVIALSKSETVHEPATPSPNQGENWGKTTNITDITHKFRHNNASMRLEAVRALSQMVKRRQEWIEHIEITSLLPRILPLLTDMADREIRLEATKLLQLLMSQKDQFRTEPVHRLLTAHLCCALSHIDSSVARDSLLLLDFVINEFPDLVMSSLRSFLNSILAQLGQKADCSGPGDKSGPSFSGMLDHKVTHNEWRVAVLTRLEKLLKTAVIHHKQLVDGSLPEMFQGTILAHTQRGRGLYPNQNAHRYGPKLVDTLRTFKASNQSNDHAMGMGSIRTKVLGLIAEVSSEMNLDTRYERLSSANVPSSGEQNETRKKIASVLLYLEECGPVMSL
eukprot:maker-scaffold886_size84816-snap-gene-0.25 protein:Tk01965 transcript:maker-scaffold886_size84816-snap-gene-0.25-mRNA-1 annotation:"testis-expressed sequence 10-like protein"